MKSPARRERKSRARRRISEWLGNIPQEWRQTTELEAQSNKSHLEKFYLFHNVVVSTTVIDWQGRRGLETDLENGPPYCCPYTGTGVLSTCNGTLQSFPTLIVERGRRAHINTANGEEGQGQFEVSFLSSKAPYKLDSLSATIPYSVSL